MSDCIATKNIRCFVQENGIIRLMDGRLIGRLCDDCIKYEDLPNIKSRSKKRKENRK